MKKLFLVLCCFTAVILTSSCTADSPVETKNENLITPNVPAVPVNTVYAEDKEDPIPPKK